MKKLVKLLLSLCLLILISGCPYESEVALHDSGKATIDQRFIGKWYSIDPKHPTDTLVINILKFNASEYVIDYQENKLNSMVKRELWRGFITKVNGKIIFNLNALETGQVKYSFYLFDLDGNTLKVACASDQFIKKSFTRESELLEYFKENMNKPGFFEESTILYRMN